MFMYILDWKMYINTNTSWHTKINNFILMFIKETHLIVSAGSFK